MQFPDSFFKVQKVVFSFQKHKLSDGRAKVVEQSRSKVEQGRAKVEQGSERGCSKPGKKWHLIIERFLREFAKTLQIWLKPCVLIQKSLFATFSPHHECVGCRWSFGRQVPLHFQCSVANCMWDDTCYSRIAHPKSEFLWSRDLGVNAEKSIPTGELFGPAYVVVSSAQFWKKPGRPRLFQRQLPQ